MKRKFFVITLAVAALASAHSLHAQTESEAEEGVHLPLRLADPRQLTAPLPGPAGENPQTIACIYNLVPTIVPGCPINGETAVPTGGSQMIVIVDPYDLPNAVNDLNVFSTQFGLPDVTKANFMQVYVDGVKPPSACSFGGPTQLFGIEEDLDIEYAHAMAPQATIVLMEGLDTTKSLFDGVDQANKMFASLNLKGEVSMSWVVPEFSNEMMYDHKYFTQSGVVYFAGSGDTPGTEYPSTSPNVVAVGGTVINRDIFGNYVDQSAWSLGGGDSLYEPIPSFQNIIKNLVFNNRGVPDVSMVGGTYMAVYGTGGGRSCGTGWTETLGTSYGAPIWAGIVNSVGAFNASSNVQNALTYANGAPAEFTDITTGSCGTHSASPGWDFCTGWGVPNGPGNYVVLHSFVGTDGTVPYAALVQGTDGNLYGTTVYGGASNAGTVFNITPSGTLTTLHSFDNTDGDQPAAALVQGTNGYFYGSTPEGGANGDGTVFTITPSGTLTTLHSFDGTHGNQPEAALVQGTNGEFYGTTDWGGPSNIGTVYSITAAGTVTTLHSFDGADGQYIHAGLVLATNGDFYGTAQQGGANIAGTVFQISPISPFPLTTLYNFCSQGGSQCTDGKYPYAGLVQGIDGNFYGTTSYGGTGSSVGGTVFKITPSGTLTTLYNFCSQGGSQCTDGTYPNAGLVQGTDGNFYGTTSQGGTSSGGTVFQMTPSGTLTTLYSFCSQSNCTDGDYPYAAALVQDTNGTFYGTTEYGGTTGDGTVFGLSVGLGPFVETQPTSGKVGAAVKILGTYLTGATNVTFNGTAATFTVKSKSEITTTVPAGTTSGTVQVVTPNGTLSSNVPFIVLP